MTLARGSVSDIRKGVLVASEKGSVSDIRKGVLVASEKGFYYNSTV